MSDNCPTCVSLVRVECSGVTGYFVPLTATQAREHELAARLKCLEAPPERDHIKIGAVDVRFRRAGWSSPNVYEATEEIQAAGAELGAHAVVVLSSKTPYDGSLQVNGEAIRWR